MEDFKHLKVGSKAHDLTLSVYRKSSTFPKEEMYVLTSQMRRAAGSVGATVAEGCGRRCDGEMNRFLQSHAAPPMSWNIICFWRETWVFSAPPISRISRRRCLRFSAC